MTAAAEPAPGLTREERAALAATTALASPTELPGSTVLLVPEAPDSPMLNRIVGLGVDAPATEADVEEALAAVDPGVSFYVAVSPAARPADLPQWLRERGLQSGWGWMAFSRGVEPAPAARTSLRIAAAKGADEIAAFGRIVCASYGLPPAVRSRLDAAAGCGWQYWLAYDGDEPAGAAGLYVCEGVGYLGFAATLPEHRGKGAQGALLAERVARAAVAGCDVLVTQTGERVEGKPSNSYRNILRAGFTETAVTANWLGRR